MWLIKMGLRGYNKTEDAFKCLSKQPVYFTPNNYIEVLVVWQQLSCFIY